MKLLEQFNIFSAEEQDNFKVTTVTPTAGGPTVLRAPTQQDCH